ncbi:Vitamin B12 import ATP-binding protein BtuD [Streptomyces tendae]
MRHARRRMVRRVARLAAVGGLLLGGTMVTRAVASEPPDASAAPLTLARTASGVRRPVRRGQDHSLLLIERVPDPASAIARRVGGASRTGDLAALRAATRDAQQDAPALSGSLRDNLLLGNPESDEAALTAVLKTTRLDGLVDRLPDGLETLVGHRGTKLSGGERQRVAIARALLRRPRLLLLDEATSQLDAVNEAALRDTVADVARTTTVLVVAHRLSTVTTADRIVVMDAGRVRAVGTTGNW